MKRSCFTEPKENMVNFLLSCYNNQKLIEEIMQNGNTEERKSVRNTSNP